jgi:pimeloyl-ACP methyl ester carboxylesterase
MPQVRANGLHLEYESFGDPAHPPVLLIMGLGAQLLLWPEDFCRALADAGYRVIRFDNRDVGLSSKLEHAGRPRLMRAAIASTLRLPVRAPDPARPSARASRSACGWSSGRSGWIANR